MNGGATPFLMNGGDIFFEALLDGIEEAVELRGIPFSPSQIAQSDPEAYKEIRAGLLSEVAVELKDSIDSESLGRLERLPQLIPKGRMIPFIGAGVSAQAGLPTWSGFLCELASGRLDPDYVKLALEKGLFAELSEEIINTVGMELFDERLLVFDSTTEPPPILSLVAALFVGAIYTTNFDPFIEKTFRSANIEIEVIRGCAQWEGLAATESQGVRPLVKLHGDRLFPNTRILSGAEYEQAYAPDGPVRRDVSHLLQKCAVVFLGCSLAPDRTLDVALEVAQEMGRRAPRHYAFLPLSDPDVDRVEREHFLNERHIFPIWYPAEDGDHRFLGLMLWQLLNT